MEFERNTLIFKNINCQFFPCISGININNFNCKFCYCPLYWIPIECEGDYSLLSNGLKDCSSCRIIHDGECGIEHVHKIINKYVSALNCE